MKDPNTESDTAAAAPAPRVKKKSGPSIVWLIPLITALIGGWLVIKTLSEKGPEIIITFKTAEGLEAGKTKIKYKDIEIGVVQSIHFSSDFSHVIVQAAMEKGTDPFLRRDTRFWVVKPQLSLRGATGLGTLLSGAYIEIEPGEGASQRRFVGLDIPPVVKAEVAGKKITLLTKRLGSIDTGSPVYYQGILAGEVLGWELGNDRKSVFIYAFIKAPYDELVQSNSRFWDVSGVDVSLGADGISVHTESIQSLLYGGIAFETPETLERPKDDVEELVFTLYESYRSIQEQSFIKKITFILFFEGSVRGLNVGAPVEFKGIKVGSVKDVRLEFDSRDNSFRIPVLIEIEPERVISRGGLKDVSPYQFLKNLVDRGLRAQLQTGSLLTGQLYIELDMHPDTPIRLVNAKVPFPELPTIPAELEQMTTSIKGILTKMEKVEMEKIGEELLASLQGANKLINNPALQESALDLKESLIAFKSIMLKLEQRVEPIGMNLERAIGAGHQTLEKTQTTMDLINEVLKPGAPFQSGLIELTDELAEMARSIRTLVDLLERNPNAVIFGKDPSGEK